MERVKQLFYYVFWIIVSIFIGIVYMRLVLGEIPKEESYNGFGFFLNLFYNYGIIYVGSIIGTIIAILFIITDVFILKNRLNNSPKSKLIKCTVLLLIAFLVFTFHYFLEKVIDII